MVAGCPFQDPGTHSRVRGIEVRGAGQDLENPASDPATAVEYSPAGGCDILGFQEACIRMTILHLPCQSWGVKGYPHLPSTLLFDSHLLPELQLPSRSVSLLSPITFSLVIFQDTSAPPEGVPFQNPGEEPTEFRDRTRVPCPPHVPPLSALATSYSEPGIRRRGKGGTFLW